MTEAEIKLAAELYRGDNTLVQVRAELKRLGHPSRSVNTLRRVLTEHGCQMRRPGRRPRGPRRLSE